MLPSEVRLFSSALPAALAPGRSGLLLSVSHRAAALDSHSYPAQNGLFTAQTPLSRARGMLASSWTLVHCQRGGATLCRTGRVAAELVAGREQRSGKAVAAHIIPVRRADSAPVGLLELLSGACLAVSAAALVAGHERQGLAAAQHAQRTRLERRLLDAALFSSLVLLLLWGRALEAASQVGALCCLPLHLRRSTGSMMMKCGAVALGCSRQRAGSSGPVRMPKDACYVWWLCTTRLCCSCAVPVQEQAVSVLPELTHLPCTGMQGRLLSTCTTFSSAVPVARALGEQTAQAHRVMTAAAGGGGRAPAWGCGTSRRWPGCRSRRCCWPAWRATWSRSSTRPCLACGTCAPRPTPTRAHEPAPGCGSAESYSRNGVCVQNSDTEPLAANCAET